jgi:hypothetical protein
MGHRAPNSRSHHLPPHRHWILAGRLWPPPWPGSWAPGASVRLSRQILCQIPPLLLMSQHCRSRRQQGHGVLGFAAEFGLQWCVVIPPPPPWCRSQTPHWRRTAAGETVVAEPTKGCSACRPSTVGFGN